jgi:flavodoxin/ferredoxin
MKSLIIYFSLTGNTRKIAEAIYKGICGIGEKCDIRNLKEVNMQSLPGYDLIGIGSPVHYAEPLNVRNFIKQMPVLKGKHCFIFYTHATWPEVFLPSILEILQPKGMITIGSGHWYGEHIDQQFPFPYPTAGHPDKIDIEEAGQFGREMVDRSRRISDGETQLIPDYPIGRETGIQIAEEVLFRCIDPTLKARFGPEFDKATHPPKAFKKIARLNMVKCRYPECTVCMDHCPMNGIDFSKIPIRFAEPCMNCLFCEMICPHGAIEVDFEESSKLYCWATKNIYAPILDRAEAEGRFRRLIPREKIDWDTPFFKKQPGHPRYRVEGKER